MDLLSPSPNRPLSVAPSPSLWHCDLVCVLMCMCMYVYMSVYIDVSMSVCVPTFYALYCAPSAWISLPLCVFNSHFPNPSTSCPSSSLPNPSFSPYPSRHPRERVLRSFFAKFNGHVIHPPSSKHASTTPHPRADSNLPPSLAKPPTSPASHKTQDTTTSRPGPAPICKTNSLRTEPLPHLTAGGHPSSLQEQSRQGEHPGKRPRPDVVKAEPAERRYVCFGVG